LTPDQWIDFQTLTGDKTDCVTGCPGWGKKTAQAALQRCGSIEGMIADPWRIPCSQKQRDSFTAWRDRIEPTRRLVRLRTDILAAMEAV
jgi:DNA polymerase-1